MGEGMRLKKTDNCQRWIHNDVDAGAGDGRDWRTGSSALMPEAETL